MADDCFVKVCRDKFDQEVDAYRRWAPHLGRRCPDLLAADEQLGVLLLSAVDGQLAQDLDLDARADAEMYRQAGEVLAMLHTLPVSDHGDDPVGAFVESAERWNLRADGIVSSDDRSWVHERVAEITPMLAGTRRCPCHRDFTPRNWIVGADANVRIIDFGHTRADFWILDVDKLWSDQWIARPDRQAAFWDGYGSEPTDDERVVLEAASALGALSTIVWSRDHRDAEYEAHGRRHLARLRR
jgi:tRNA A-37 threonylcarbamoyl transferase component Bud32